MPAEIGAFALHNFQPPDDGNDDPLSEELALPEHVVAGFELAPPMSVVLEVGRITILVRRRSRRSVAELTATVEGGDRVVTIPLRPLGSWLRGTADWPYDDALTLLRLAAET